MDKEAKGKELGAAPTLHHFDAGDPGAWGNVILDGSGNIYGVTEGTDK